jgi:hypothetical protein
VVTGLKQVLKETSFVQEAGYMEADNHIIGFLTADSVLYALVLHPAYRGTLFISEPFLWMSTEVTQRMVSLSFYRYCPFNGRFYHRLLSKSLPSPKRQTLRKSIFRW